jgi:hypothetical protein
MPTSRQRHLSNTANNTSETRLQHGSTQAEQRRQLIHKAEVERTLDALRKAKPKVAEECGL